MHRFPSPLAAGFFTGKHSNGNAPAAGTRFAVVPYLKDGFLQPSFAEVSSQGYLRVHPHLF